MSTLLIHLANRFVGQRSERQNETRLHAERLRPSRGGPSLRAWRLQPSGEYCPLFRGNTLGLPGVVGDLDGGFLLLAHHCLGIPLLGLFLQRTEKWILNTEPASRGDIAVAGQGRVGHPKLLNLAHLLHGEYG